MSHQGSHHISQGEAESNSPFHGERRWIFAGLAVLLIFAIGSAIYNGGWSQGFGMGLLAGGALDGETMTPYMLYRGYGFHPWGFFGGFFRILFFVFLFAMFAKFLGFWRWRMHNGHGHHSRWQGGPWSHGPWQQGPSQPGPYGQPQAPQGQEPPGTQSGAQSGAQSGPEGDKPKNTVWLDV